MAYGELVLSKSVYKKGLDDDAADTPHVC